MTGEAHWLTPLLLIACGVGIAALFYAGALLDRRFRLFRGRFDCPVDAKKVDTTLIRDAKIGQFTSVQSCSHFANPARVTCDQHCIEALNTGSPAGSGASIPRLEPLPSARRGRALSN